MRALDSKCHILWDNEKNHLNVLKTDFQMLSTKVTAVLKKTWVALRRAFSWIGTASEALRPLPQEAPGHSAEGTSGQGGSPWVQFLSPISAQLL